MLALPRCLGDDYEAFPAFVLLNLVQMRGPTGHIAALTHHDARDAHDKPSLISVG